MESHLSAKKFTHPFLPIVFYSLHEFLAYEISMGNVFMKSTFGKLLIILVLIMAIASLLMWGRDASANLFNKREFAFREGLIPFQPELILAPGSHLHVNVDHLDRQECYVEFHKTGDFFSAQFGFKIALDEVSWDATGALSVQSLPIENFSGLVQSSYPLTDTNLFLQYTFKVDAAFTFSSGGKVEIREGLPGQEFSDMKLQAEFICTPIGQFAKV